MGISVDQKGGLLLRSREGASLKLAGSQVEQVGAELGGHDQIETFGTLRC